MSHHHTAAPLVAAGNSLQASMGGAQEVVYFQGRNARLCCCACPCCPPAEYKVSNLLIEFHHQTSCCASTSETIDTSTVTEVIQSSNCLDRCRGNSHLDLATTDKNYPSVNLYIKDADSVFRNFSLGVLGDNINVEGEPIWHGTTNGGCCGTGCCNCLACTKQDVEIRESLVIHKRWRACCCAPLFRAFPLRGVKDIKKTEACLRGGLQFNAPDGTEIDHLHIPRGEINDVYDKVIQAHKDRLLKLRGALSSAPPSAAPSQVSMN